MTETSPCPLCGRQNDLPTVGSRVDRYSPGRSRWTVVRCPQCKVAWVNPRPTVEDIGNHYPETYAWHDEEDAADQRGDHARLSLPEKLEQAYRYHILRWETRLLQKLTGRTTGTVLDVGCAAGDRMAVMKEAGFEPSGIEVSPDAEHARRYGPVHHGPIATAPYQPGSFDVVTLYNVLEHIHDGADMVRRCRNLLKPGGHLLVEVPNLESFQARLFGTRWAAMDVPRDLYYFTRQSLEQTVEPHGFREEAFTTRFSFWHPPTMVLSLFPGLDPRQIWAERQSGSMSLVKRALWGLCTLGVAPWVVMEGLVGKGALMTTVWRRTDE